MRSAPVTDPIWAAVQRGREELRRSIEAAELGRREVAEHRRKGLARTGQR